MRKRLAAALTSQNASAGGRVHVAEQLSVADAAAFATNASFCLAPTGDGFGNRLEKAILLGGCVPLIIQPSVRMPLEELVPYSEIALRAEIGDVPRLEEMLEAVTPRRHAQMRRAMLRHAAAFTWLQTGCGGDAYDRVVSLLRRRADLVRGEIEARFMEGGAWNALVP